MHNLRLLLAITLENSITLYLSLKFCYKNRNRKNVSKLYRPDYSLKKYSNFVF